MSLSQIQRSRFAGATSQYVEQLLTAVQAGIRECESESNVLAEEEREEEDRVHQPQPPCATGSGAEISHALYRQEDLESLLSEAKHECSDVREKLMPHLRLLERTGPNRRLASALTMEQLAGLRSEFPNFATACDRLLEASALAFATHSPVSQIPPLLLGGAPGLGKTQFAKAVADLLDCDLLEISVPSTARFAISGLDLGYGSGRPGRIFTALARGRCGNLICVLDEIDKPSQSEHVLPVLLSLLEPSSAKSWQDEAVRLPLDCSKIQYIATANDVEAVDSALLSRFVVVEVSTPTPEQSREIAARIFAKMVAERGLSNRFSSLPSSAVLEKVAQGSVRDIRKALLSALARAILRGGDELRPEDVVSEAGSRKVGFGFVQ